MEEGYKIVKKWVNDLNFEILVLQIPDGDIEDKLTTLAPTQGNIGKESYYQFLMMQCIANVQQLAHAVQLTLKAPEYDQVKLEIIEFILEVNPKLLPEKLVINKNGILKLANGKKLKEGERSLTGNKFWDAPPEPKGKDFNAYRVGPDGYPSANQEPPPELEFTVVQKWWKRLNIYVEIKQYNGDELLPKIANDKRFYDESGFRTYVVTTCVANYGDLFARLDSEGISKRVSAQKLMQELYNLCKDVNPYLVFDKVQDAMEDSEEGCSGCQVERAEPVNSMESFAKCKPANKSAKLKFKDIRKEELLGLCAAMKTKLIGQNSAVEVISRSIQRASVGLKDPVKPIGSFLFVGPTGVGKTLASKVLAEKLTKSNKYLVTIDCSEYSGDHEYAKLLGAPPGYIGHDEGGTLTKAIIKNPFSVVVFDEIEKASEKIRELLLQILEEGRLTDGKGQTVTFRDTVIIMTSNVGVQEVEAVGKTIGFGDVAEITDDRKNKAIERAVKKKFKPEFINRLDAIVYFNKLTEQDYLKIIDIELGRLYSNLQESNSEYKGIGLAFEDKVKKFVFEKGIDPVYGARPLKRCIEKEIADPLAFRLLSENNLKKGCVHVGVRRGKIVFDIEEFAEVPAVEMISLEAY